MRTRSKFSPSLKVLAMWVRGMTPAQVAKATGLAVSTIHWKLSLMAKLLRRPGHLSPAASLARWAVLSGFCVAIVAMAGIPSGPTPVTLAWNAQPGVDTFYLYASTNISLPVAQWTPLTNAPGTNATATITMQPGAMFFYITASNFWGESGPSNVTNTPVVPQTITNLNLRRGP